MKQHLASDWQDLSTTQLLNWPHVQVMFRTEDICFTRRQATEYVRYLNFKPHESNKSNQSIIEDVHHRPICGRPTKCYSYTFLKEYFQVYMEALISTTKVKSLVSPSKLEEIQTILSQFLEDVRYIDVNNSIATNTAVLFRLSHLPFIRNKRLVRNNEDTKADEERVAYCEKIIPKIRFVLLYFKAKQKPTPLLSFEHTDEIKASQNMNVILPDICYKCSYCQLAYSCENSKKRMLDHLKNHHKMEPHVHCTLCKNQFSVLDLAACRWKHSCLESTSTAK
ncbi:hypothetical protein GEV33_014423 [Tenebrio molitor]|uniref:Uncharacterized protein n=1 Tax=Tenebrio molitor TaxID=7067 RepID=A0A8J6H6V8_TENMO|nr:hypothetical protein GEV33_014423 [Tenebrio molitor]